MLKKIKYLSLIFLVFGLILLFLKADNPFHFYLSPIPTSLLIHYIDRFESPIPFSLKLIPPLFYFIIALGIFYLKNWARFILILLQSLNIAMIILTIVSGYGWVASAPPGTYGNVLFDTLKVIAYFTPLLLFCIFCIYFLLRRDVQTEFKK